MCLICGIENFSFFIDQLYTCLYKAVFKYSYIVKEEGEKLKFKNRLLALLTTSVLILIMVNAVQAGWSALNSGYAVTTDYHGKDVLPGTTVTATAGTTDPDVTSVTFKWKAPDETVVFTETVPVTDSGEKWNGKPIYCAQSSYTIPSVLGDWGVQAFFIGEGGKKKAQIEDTISIRATSFFVIPEVATIFLAASSMLAFGVYAYRRKKH